MSTLLPLGPTCPRPPIWRRPPPPVDTPPPTSASVSRRLRPGTERSTRPAAPRAKEASKRGAARDVVASTGDRFSYSYEIPADLTRHKASFEFENHSQEGKFKLHSLAWVGFSDSGSSGRESVEYDTVTFTCFGVWSKGDSHTVQQAAVQISTAPQRPYVSIQINAGNVSNVNTKPANIRDALP